MNFGKRNFIDRTKMRAAGHGRPGGGFVTGWKPQAGIRDLPYVKGALDSWARWSLGSRGGGISLTGRLMQGARANVCPGWIEDMQARRAHDPWCPQCHGTGRLLLKLTATQHTRRRVCTVCEGRCLPDPATGRPASECFRCRGTGEITVISLKVNPAAIRGTSHAGTGCDWQSMILDDLISGWREKDETFWMNRVVIREYFYNGTQLMKARQMRVSESFYKKNLRAAYCAIDQELFEKMPKDWG